MNKRRTKGLFGERSSIGRPLFERLCSLSRRSVPSALLLLAFALLPFARVEGYNVMDNDRILLMNNDSKLLAKINNQGYYDTNSASNTYWVHTGTAPLTVPAKYLLAGTNHVMYTQGGKKLWELSNCRAGSGTVLASNRNYIPWSSTAKSILTSAENIPVSESGVQGVGSVSMRNVEGACIYSPCYEEGIGTIYFDAVNAFTVATSTRLVLEIATNVTAVAESAGMHFSAIEDYDLMDWKTCPFTLFTVEGRTLSEVGSGITNVTLSSTAGGSSLFYRIRACLNYRGDIRFRIRRMDKESGAADTTGLVLVDNIIASYPPMTAELCRYGMDYDEELKGASVLGCIGDFSSPFLSYQAPDIKGHAYVNFLRNEASALAVVVSNPRMVYRWRYLNQIVGDWHILPFDQVIVDSNSYMTSNLVSSANIFM